MTINLNPLRVIAAGIFVLALMISPAVLAVDLMGVHDLAVKSDPTLQAAAFRRQATDENKKQAWANLLPQLDLSARHERGSNKNTIMGTTVSDVDVDTENYRAELLMSLYNQGNYEQLDVARGQITQAEAVYQTAFQDFLLRVADSYFLVLTNIDNVTFAEAEEEALQRQYEQAEQRFEVGLTAVTDVHEARASYDNARARAIVARNNLEDAKEALRELTGVLFEEYDRLQEDLPLVEPNPNSAEEWVQVALSENPTLLASRAAVDIADATMRLERSGHYPTLELNASYNDFTNNEFLLENNPADPLGTTDLEVDDTRYGLILRIPIYRGGRVSSRTRQARYLLDATTQDMDQTQRATLRNTENSYRAVLAGIQEVEAFKQAEISAESALEATQAGFEVGTRTIVDVLIANQRLFQSQRDNSEARHQYILNHLRLKANAGRLSSEDLAVVNQLLD
jgi:outer membrane protein